MPLITYRPLLFQAWRLVTSIMFLPLFYIVTVPESIAWDCFNCGQCSGPKSYHIPDLAAKDTFYSAFVLGNRQSTFSTQLLLFLVHHEMARSSMLMKILLHQKYDFWKIVCKRCNMYIVQCQRVMIWFDYGEGQL